MTEPDKENPLVKLYTQYKEIINVCGFVLLMAFTLGGSWTKWEAQAQDIENLKTRTSNLEYQSGRILQSLDDIKDFLHVPQRRQ